jgi:OOP family OmpA-OmpF porin
MRRKKVLIVIGVLFLVFVAGYVFLGDRYYPDGTVNSSKSQEIRFPKDKKILNPFVLVDSESDFTFSSEDNFNFKLSDNEILRPISKDIITGIAEMQLLFVADESRRVEVSGWYSSSEKNASSFPNLGLARANAIKDYLIIQGIPSSRIDLKGIQKGDLKHYKKTLYGPVEFKISRSASNSEEKK